MCLRHSTYVYSEDPILCMSQARKRYIHLYSIQEQLKLPVPKAPVLMHLLNAMHEKTRTNPHADHLLKMVISRCRWYQPLSKRLFNSRMYYPILSCNCAQNCAIVGGRNHINDRWLWRLRLLMNYVGAGAAAPVIPSIDSTGPQEQKRFISPYAEVLLV